MTIEQLEQYEVLEHRKIEDINAECYRLRHKKSGARLALVSNQDENKVFYIGFRTPPEDSTGLPHILEHSVLCGSKEFPAKDPFVELAKGSLNTFLNAMTYPDKTVYPIASCNDKDFQNLMHVYMDAVFFPNIYEREEIFRQEGWHYELENTEGELTYNGVVYNEMKGAFSSPESVLSREVMNSLFPDTPYGVESGGDPQVIPELTYETFLEFHGRYYHPSNSYIYLYGNMDMVEKLLWLDETYLSKFDAIQIDSALKLQTPFSDMKELYRKYPVAEEEKEEENTYLSYNKVVGTSLDKELTVAFQVLEYVLLTSPGAVLKKALIDKGIGRDIYGYYEGEIYQPYFTIVAKNADAEQKNLFEETITDTLKEVVKKGIDVKSVEAALNSMEFKFREADFGNYPKGLIYGLQLFNTWLYDDAQPFSMMEMLETYQNLRQKNGTGYYEQLIQKYLLDNQHGTVLVVEPEKGLTAKRDAVIAEKLEQYKKSLTDEEREALVSRTKSLKKYQEEPSSKEELESIPLLNVSDIKRESQPFVNEEKYVDDTLVLYHNIFTNNIGYVKVIFDTSAVPVNLIPYVALLKYIYGYIDTETYTYTQLGDEINCNTGGIIPRVSVCAKLQDKDKLITQFTFSAKALENKIGFAFEMIEEMLHRSKLNDTKRLGEIIAELRSRLQMEIQSDGHIVARSRAASYYSQSAHYAELIDGIEFYRFVKGLDETFADCKDDIVAKLKETSDYIFTMHNLMIDFTGEEKVFPQLAAFIMDFKDTLSDKDYEKHNYHFELEKKNEGFKTSSQVQYVARCGDYTADGLEYTGALRVLKNVISYEYLWGQVRVIGGAYGCMNGYGRTGNSFFVSYRDPNLEKTMEVYEKAPEFIRNCKFDNRSMTKFIIGAISELDTPLTPMARGTRSYMAYLQGLDEEMIWKERCEVLDTSVEVLHSLAPYIEAILAENAICVIGNEEKIEQQKKMFGDIETL